MSETILGDVLTTSMETEKPVSAAPNVQFPPFPGIYNCGLLVSNLLLYIWYMSICLVWLQIFNLFQNLQMKISMKIYHKSKRFIITLNFQVSFYLIQFAGFCRVKCTIHIHIICIYIPRIEVKNWILQIWMCWRPWDCIVQAVIVIWEIQRGMRLACDRIPCSAPLSVTHVTLFTTVENLIRGMMVPSCTVGGADRVDKFTAALIALMYFVQ